MHRAIADPRHSAAPGCVAVGFEKGRLAQFAAAGLADIDEGRPLDRNTLFYGASLSKQFTALAAATLIADGKLGLDDDVRRYLPELPRYRAPVTVAMLMHHTSGIRDSLGLLRMAGMTDVGRASKQEALRLLFRQADTAFVPGTRYAYSNGGYLLLAEIVERVAGMPFAQYAHQAIFAPLGMPNAYFLDDASPRPGTFAHGYVPAGTDGGAEGSGFIQRDTFPRFSGSGGLMLSMADLAQYEADIEHGRRVFTPEVTRILLTPGRYSDGTPIDDGKGLSYGGGLHIGRKGGQRVIRHGGSAEAFKHAYLRLPETHRAFAVLCNRGDWKAGDRLDRIMAANGVPAPGLPDVQPMGLFHSPELNTDYRIVAEGTGLSVQVTSPLVDETRILHFIPEDDGAYHAGATTITPTGDPARIVVSRGSSGPIIFRAVSTPSGSR
ncbi:serine hydrolase domain-containing protein [Pelagerythrobacter marensis]|uniref:D-aminopeptidase n=1 Tax=Pelagerythrobacter marensis TaxID=543877 RepID=A0A0G3X543_9SPHN|nr:serine hydrolase domain-containing protein [Pelagerythrobacter marensis]AKM06635.1 D-aminopeptidase [Pelagerythrobacter marensis]